MNPEQKEQLGVMKSHKEARAFIKSVMSVAVCNQKRAKLQLLGMDGALESPYREWMYLGESGPSRGLGSGSKELLRTRGASGMPGSAVLTFFCLYFHTILRGRSHGPPGDGWLYPQPAWHHPPRYPVPFPAIPSD